MTYSKLVCFKFHICIKFINIKLLTNTSLVEFGAHVHKIQQSHVICGYLVM
jgi:hypothetical protein